MKGYEFKSGQIALLEQLRQKAQPLPSFQIPEHQERARILRTREDKNLTIEAERKIQAALSLQNEIARKKEKEFEEKVWSVVEKQEAQRRENILQGLKL